MRWLASMFVLFWISAYGQTADSVRYIPEAFKKLSPDQFDKAWTAEPRFEPLDLADSSDAAIWAWSMENLAEIARSTDGDLATSHQLRTVDIPSTLLKWLVHTHPIVGGAWKDGRMVYATQPYSPSPGDLKYSETIYKRKTMRIITATPVKGQVFSYTYRTDKKGTNLTYNLPNGSIVMKTLSLGATPGDVSQLNRDMTALIAALERN